MNDAFKIIIGSQLRQWVLLLAGAALSHKLLSQQTIDYITNSSPLFWFTVAAAAAAALRGLYVRLRSKTAQKIALDMPPGSSMERLKTVVSQTPMTSIIKTNPTAIILALLLPCFLFTSCATTGDPVLVNAEKVTTTSFDVFNAYVHVEYNYKTQLKAQFGDAPHKLANEIRLHGREWLRTARALEDTYELNRTPENKANMLTALAVVETAVAEAQKYMAVNHS